MFDGEVPPSDCQACGQSCPRHALQAEPEPPSKLLCPPCWAAVTSKVCAYCGKPFGAECNHRIHRDGFGIGPEVPLCDDCGGFEEPSCPEIWARIAQETP